MVMRLLRTQTENESIIERIMYTKRYSLLLDRKKCVGCEVCSIVCPKEAISPQKPIKTEGIKLEQPMIVIDENRCHFCGICKAICPFNALTLLVNGEKVVPVVDKESFPVLVRDIDVEEEKCPMGCKECEEACPFDLIQVSTDETKTKVRVKIDKERCPCCRLCEAKCPPGALVVRKIILGSIDIHNEKCPEGCHDCADVCPVPGVLRVSDTGKVEVNGFSCVYCGVCKIICPVQEALEVGRSSVRHTTVRSGAWNKALEKLTSTRGIAKELQAKLIFKARESVKRRTG